MTSSYPMYSVNGWSYYIQLIFIGTFVWFNESHWNMLAAANRKQEGLLSRKSLAVADVKALSETIMTEVACQVSLQIISLEVLLLLV
jgi:hypothetical protein